MSKPFALTAVFGAIVAALALAACGSSSPSDPAASERESEQQAETKFADFARCLREHGVQAEAISHPGGGHGLKIGPGPGASGDHGKAEQGPEAMEAAQKACARYQPAPQKANLSPQQKVEAEEAVQKFARCMREHGIKVEATANGGAIRIGIRAHPGSGPNPESPGFQRAQNSCQKLLPKFGGAKGGPGPGPPPGAGKEGSSGSQSTGH